MTRSVKSEAAGERTRRRIVTAAAKAFRQHGLEGIGVREVMKQAGMTQGSFYFHFRDKQALFAEASREAFSSCATWIFDQVDQASPGQRLRTLIDLYLSKDHRDAIGAGCTMAALGGDMARADRGLRENFSESSEQMIERAAPYFRGADDEERRRKARVLLASMAGVLMSARVLGDRGAGGELLADARESLFTAFSAQEAS